MDLTYGVGLKPIMILLVHNLTVGCIWILHDCLLTAAVLLIAVDVHLILDKAVPVGVLWHSSLNDEFIHLIELHGLLISGILTLLHRNAALDLLDLKVLGLMAHVAEYYFWFSVDHFLFNRTEVVPVLAFGQRHRGALIAASVVVIVCWGCLTLTTSASTHVLDGMFRPRAFLIAAVLRMILLLEPRLFMVDVSSLGSLHLLVRFRGTPSRVLHVLGTITSPSTFSTSNIRRRSLSIAEVLMVLLLVMEIAVVFFA